ncbi:4-amino-4-deoxychorismate mutase [Streptomyces sp. NRRL F-4489]|uniref:chorismate mutase family protein n=1 Tax=Streptomyces sp. NRRL F-4489 TaxID=1609095 RepID=UPI0007485522|nr:chorismate mutase family protein [Streptomyces sp. NRRL F-4489]KUL35396.1 4-amino-4-deoxychorismate mutase [Streptomyces sp. NRRL F-4489]
MATTEPNRSEPEQQLAALRAELDALDEQLLDVVRRRVEVCVRIAHHKSAHGVPMMQPHRIGVVHERAARYGERHGVDREFLRRLYDLIIEETCRVEDLVMGNTPAH